MCRISVERNQRVARAKIRACTVNHTASRCGGKGTVWDVSDVFEDKQESEWIRFSFNKHDLNEPHVSIKGFFA